jgi:hypothetical protein
MRPSERVSEEVAGTAKPGANGPARCREVSRLAVRKMKAPARLCGWLRRKKKVRAAASKSSAASRTLILRPLLLFD